MGEGTRLVDGAGETALAAVAELSIKLMREIERLQAQIDEMRDGRAAA